MEILKQTTKGSKSNGKTQTKSSREDTSILLKLNHPNLLGIFLDTTTGKASKIQILKSLFEFPEERGNLQEYLFSNRTSENELVSWCHDICKGMEYLHSRNIVHRGLSIRSVILSKDMKTVKISYLQTGVKVVRRNAVVSYSSTGFAEVIPALKLTRRELNTLHSSRECLLEGRYRYTTASDVWAFGMTMMEIFNSGLSPYRGMKRKHADALIKEGKSPLSFVELNISHEIVQSVIKPALRAHPELRHSFSTLCETFADLKRKTFSNDIISGFEKLRTPRTSVFQKHSSEGSARFQYPLGRNVMYWRNMVNYFMQKQLLMLS